MNIQDVIGELLYIGIVAEKGRCYEKGWRFGYKRIIYKHVAALNELQKCLLLTDEKSVNAAIGNFITVCKENSEIGKFYNFSDQEISELHIGINSIVVNRLMDRLFLDLLTEIRKTYIRKREVYDLLCALHNLPRVYLGKNKETLCRLKQEAISEQDAIEYAFDNMNTDMKKKYQHLLERKEINEH